MSATETKRPPMIDQADPADVPPPVRLTFASRLVQLGGNFVLRGFALFFYRAEVRWPRYRPVGPCVYAGNHRSFFDPIAVGMWFPRPMSYFARASLWKIPIIGHTLRVMYGIPVDRDNPGLSSMKGAVERLRQGISVVVFPEGTRTRTGRLGPFREGPALFARRAGVPVVPVYIYNSEFAWPRGAMFPRLGALKMIVRFGDPLVAPSALTPRQQDVWITSHLRAWMLKQEAAFMRKRLQA